MIKRVIGQPNIKGFKKKASTAFSVNDVVTRDTSGFLVVATGTTPRSELIGLMTRAIASTDSDYASNTLVEIDCFEGSGDESFEVDIDTGTLVQAMVGKEWDLNDENGVNVTSNVQGHFKITRLLSTTKGRGYFLMGGRNPGLRAYSQTISSTDFTDGGGTSGTKALNVSIPAGAVFVRTLITALTGFTGDTTAVVKVGDGTTTDRYSITSGSSASVFTTAAAGIDPGAASGTLFHSAAKTPTVTVTSGADFTSVVAGTMTVTMFWYEATA